MGYATKPGELCGGKTKLNISTSAPQRDVMNPAQPGARVEEWQCESNASHGCHAWGSRTELIWGSRSTKEEKVKDERRALRVLGAVRGSTWQGGRRAELQGLTVVGES